MANKTIAVFSNITTEKFLAHTTEIKKYTELGALYGKDQTRYNEYARCAIDSFKKWHPDIETIYINDDNLLEYLHLFGDAKISNNAVVQKLILALESMKYYNANKLIILDIDLIVCARLTEMLEDDTTDMLLSMNYNRYETTEFWAPPKYVMQTQNGQTFEEILNINTGVMCFNNINALSRAVELCLIHPTIFGEQGAINELAVMEQSYSYKMLDGPYIMSSVAYNVKSKGVDESGLIFDIAEYNPTKSYIRNWYVKDNKLYTPDHKQIKVWHIAEGFHGRPDEDFKQLTYRYKNKLFNPATIEFFETECNCKNFFTYDENSI